MSRSPTLQVRIDQRLKDEADALFAKLGLDTSTAIRMFLTQATLQRRIPFDVALRDEVEPEALDLQLLAECANDDPAESITMAEMMKKLGITHDELHPHV